MAFDLPVTELDSPSPGSRLRGFLDVVDWIGDETLARRSLTGSQSRPGEEVFDLSAYVLDGTKTAESSPGYIDGVTTTQYLRREFSTGEATRADAEARTRAAFDAAAETAVTTAWIDGATTVALAEVDTTLAAISCLERALATITRSSGVILAPEAAAAYLNDIDVKETTPRGHRVVYSPGATPVAERADVVTPPTELTLYAMAQPFGVRTAPMVTSNTVGDDIDFELNSLFVTIEATWSLNVVAHVTDASPTAQMFSVTIDLGGGS